LCLENHGIIDLRKKYYGQHLWGRGYFVSSVGINEEIIRQYIQNQAEHDQREQQMRLWKN
jgi:putative transposase